MTGGGLLLGLAPMAGFTDYPMREICCRMGANYTCTEMVSAVGLISSKPGNAAYEHLLATSPRETPPACQLFGRDPAAMGEAALRVTALGRFSSLDINMGCPVRKVVSLGEGSALMRTPELAGRIMESVVRATYLPVTVKMRLGFEKGDMSAVTIAKMAQDKGLSGVTVHGRTREMQFSGRADWASIALVKKSVSIPVIANGDVFTARDAVRVIDETGCDGLMIGRGAIGNPWLFAGASAALSGREAKTPSCAERLSVIIGHARALTGFKGERLGVMQLRSHLCRYISGMRGAAGFRREICAARTLSEVEELLTRFFGENELCGGEER